MEDWRSFKARLVSKENQKQQGDVTAQPTQQGGWLYEQTTIETGCLLVHSPQPADANQVLRNYHLFQSVVLTTEHNNDVTKGFILNKPTDITLDLQCTEGDELGASFPIQYGGDSHSIHDKESTVYTCLHSLPPNEDVRACSSEIMAGLYSTSLLEAKDLIRRGHATSSDFLCIAGYTSWTTLDIMVEMRMGLWKSLSVDTESLKQGLEHPHEVWEQLLGKIGWLDPTMENENQYRPSPLIDLGVEMQQEWIQERLMLDGLQRTNREQPRKGDIGIQPGDVLRAIPNHEFLFHQQELHLCLILILQDDKDFTVGILLNHPTSKEEELTSLPIRYGGLYDQLDVDQEMPAWALHRASDNNQVGGEPIGNSFVKSSIEQVVLALEQGVAKQGDFLVVRGLCIWDKKEDTEFADFHQHYRQGRFEKVANNAIGPLWEALSLQQALCPNSVETNWEHSVQAWKLGGKGGQSISSNDRIHYLGGEVVKIWTLSSLLD